MRTRKNYVTISLSPPLSLYVSLSYFGIIRCFVLFSALQHNRLIPSGGT